MFIATVNYFTVGHYCRGARLFREIMYYIAVLRTTFRKRETRITVRGRIGHAVVNLGRIVEFSRYKARITVQNKCSGEDHTYGDPAIHS